MPRLSDLQITVSLPQLERATQRLSDVVAAPGFAPREWQVTAPDSMWGKGVPVAESGDLDRVLALPRRPKVDLNSPQAQVMVEMISRRYSNGRPAGAGCDCARMKRTCITKLLPVQAWALYEIGVCGGLLGAVPVGGGKTIIGLLSALALPWQTSPHPITGQLRPSPHVVLLVPPSLLGQLQDDYDLLSQHFLVPSLVVHENVRSTEVPPIFGRPAPVLHVLPYSRLSLPNSSAWMESVAPDAIVADEADKLKDLTSATTSRVMRYFAGHGDTRFCGWTGSLSDHSVTEYTHLAALALRYGSPLPLDLDTAEDWGRALDAVPNPAPAGALIALCAPGEHVRHGFQRRLAETMGVIMVEESTVLIEATGREVDLCVRERVAPPIPRSVQEALDSVRNFVRPDGEELIDALSMAKCAAEVACGLYYYWVFPEGMADALIREWLEARKEYFKELRVKLLTRAEYLDSPHLCETAAQRFYGEREPRPDRPTWKSLCYPRWAKVKPLVKPKTHAHRISDYLVQDAVRWGKENRGIIWYSMREFGEWVAQESGLTMHTGGPKAGEKLKAERGERSIIASIKSHGRGRNGLQFLFNRQLVANVPASATAWEQLLGRLHRRGQTQGDVSTEVYSHTEEFRKSIAQALRRAAYVEGTLGAKQKLAAAWEGDEPDDDFASVE